MPYLSKLTRIYNGGAQSESRRSMNIEQCLIGALEMGKTHVKLYFEQKCFTVQQKEVNNFLGEEGKTHVKLYFEQKCFTVQQKEVNNFLGEEGSAGGGECLACPGRPCPPPPAPSSPAPGQTRTSH